MVSTGAGFVGKGEGWCATQGNGGLPFSAVCKHALSGVKGGKFGRALSEAVRLCVCSFCLVVIAVWFTVAFLGAGLAVTKACSSNRSVLGRAHAGCWLHLSLFLLSLCFAQDFVLFWSVFAWLPALNLKLFQDQSVVKSVLLHLLAPGSKHVTFQRGNSFTQGNLAYLHSGPTVGALAYLRSGFNSPTASLGFSCQSLHPCWLSISSPPWIMLCFSPCPQAPTLLSLLPVLGRMPQPHLCTTPFLFLLLASFSLIFMCCTAMCVFLN